MATRYETETLLTAYLKTEFGDANVSIPEIEYKSPYYKIVNGSWIVNENIKTTSKKIVVNEESALDEQSNTRIVLYKVHRTTGYCWFDGEVPVKRGYFGKFDKDLDAYLKTLAPVTAPGIILASKKFDENSYFESVAIVGFYVGNSDNAITRKVYKIFYRQADHVMIHKEVAIEQWPTIEW